MHPLRFALLAPLCLLAALSPSPLFAQEQSTPTPSVVVGKVEVRDINPALSFIGRVEAVEQVEIRARVEGYLEQRTFEEGRKVKKGDLLFTIEKAPYEIEVTQRKADLAGAQATLKNAREELARKQSLRKKKVVSEASLDTAEASETLAVAGVMQAKAALDRAELDLSYTDIYSPIDGQISRAHYSVGNLVGPSSEPLATVTSLDPIYVTVPISEKEILDARRQGIQRDNPPVVPYLLLSDGKQYPHAGRFNYLDSKVDQTTDTITARAEFPNPGNVLLPGQFVNVQVKQKQPLSALVVPQAAVQKDQQGYFVLTVDRGNKVGVRRVEMGDQIETVWVVENGLEEGERVIVQGIQKVQPDMVVNPVEGGA